MIYKIGDSCQLEVLGMHTTSKGYDYLEVLGEDDKVYQIHNILKYQYSNIPSTIYGKVVGYCHNGSLRIIQDEPKTIQEHYEIGHYYAFNICGEGIDSNEVSYYEIEDDFCIHRWYSKGDYNLMDDIILEAKSINNTGYINFVAHKNSPTLNITQQSTLVSDPILGLPVFDGPDENHNVEYKTSIVFTSRNECNIDEQMLVIVEEIAAFMNADGGTLYIGIHDKTHEIVGFQNDLPYINGGNSKFAGSYKQDNDGYQLKIRDSLTTLCTTSAGSLVKIDFPEQSGCVYCRICIEAANRPIWVKGNMLFQRQGNQKRLLHNDNITTFITERLGKSILKIINPNQATDFSNNNIGEVIHNAVKKAINDRRREVAAPSVNTSQDKIRWWVVWNQDATYFKSRAESTDANVYKQIPVYDETSNLAVVFCYKRGTINKVALSDFLKKATMGKIKRDGFSTKDELIDMFITNPNNYIAIYSADQGGTEYVKIHPLINFNNTQGGGNLGAYSIPRLKGQILKVKILTPIEALQFDELIYGPKQTLMFGTNLDDVNFQNKIEMLSVI